MKIHPRTFSPEIPVGAIFASEGLKEAQRRLHYLVEARGVALFTGEVGTGKTIAIRAFTAKLATSAFQVLYTHACPIRSPLRSIVEELLVQLGEPIPHDNLLKGLRKIREALVAYHERNRLPFVILDDAHLLDAQAFLQLKTLTNFQMDAAWPLCLLLVGAPSVLRTLATRELEEIRQRLLFAYPMRGLRKEEVEPYVRARLSASGYEMPLFPKDVLDELYLHSQGNVRLLNQLANLCILAMAGEQKDLVDRNCLLSALAEIQSIGNYMAGGTSIAAS